MSRNILFSPTPFHSQWFIPIPIFFPILLVIHIRNQSHVVRSISKHQSMSRAWCFSNVGAADAESLVIVRFMAFLRRFGHRSSLLHYDE